MVWLRRLKFSGQKQLARWMALSALSPQNKEKILLCFFLVKSNGPVYSKTSTKSNCSRSRWYKRIVPSSSLAYYAHRDFALRGFDFPRNLVGPFVITNIAIFKLDVGMVSDSAFAMTRENPNQFLKPLGSAKMAQLRKMWFIIQIVIIKEMSMMSPERIAHLHQRLCEINELNHYTKTVPLLANFAVIFMGDLLQLPPEKARSIFERPSNPS